MVTEGGMRRPATPSLLYILGLVAALAALALASLGAQAQEVTPVSNATIRLLAIDADPTGNTATSLGPVDPCIRVETGAQFDVDVIVDAIPAERQLIGWQMVVKYDQDLLEVTGVDKNFLIGAKGQYQPFDVAGSMSDSLPDNDGSLVEAFADLASNSPAGANMESGPGVLMRITFRAKSAGAAAVYIDQEGISINDNTNHPIGIDSLGSATVAVGQDCPSTSPGAQITALPPTPAPVTPGAAPGTSGPAPGETVAPTATPGLNGVAPPPTPVQAMPGLGAGGDGGTSGVAAGIGGAAASLGGVALIAGGWLFYQRRRADLARR